MIIVTINQSVDTGYYVVKKGTGINNSVVMRVDGISLPMVKRVSGPNISTITDDNRDVEILNFKNTNDRDKFVESFNQQLKLMYHSTHINDASELVITTLPEFYNFRHKLKSGDTGNFLKYNNCTTKSTLPNSRGINFPFNLHFGIQGSVEVIENFRENVDHVVDNGLANLIATKITKSSYYFVVPYCHEYLTGINRIISVARMMDVDYLNATMNATPTAFLSASFIRSLLHVNPSWYYKGIGTPKESFIQDISEIVSKNPIVL